MKNNLNYFKNSMNLRASDLFGDQELKFTLYPHQASAAWWMKTIMYNIVNPSTMKGGILADVMGLGKTNTACAVIASTPVPKTLILTPSSTRYQWIDTLLYYVKSNITICTIEDDVLYKCKHYRDKNGIIDIKKIKMFSRRDNIAISDYFVMVANYELPAKTDSINADLIRRHEWNNLFIDEGHFLRNVNPTWENINACVRHPLYYKNGIYQRAGGRFIITGTPIQMDKSDIVNIFKFIDESFFKSNNTVGLTNYLINNYLFRRNVNHLSGFMKKFMRFPETDPEYIDTIIDIPDTQLSKNISMYDYDNLCVIFQNNPSIIKQIETDEKAYLTVLLTELKYNNRVGGKNNFSETQELRTVMSFPYLNTPNILKTYCPDFKYNGGSSKINRIREIINHYKRSMVIFHHYKLIAEILVQSLNRTHGSEYTIISINGDLDDKQRYDNLKVADRLIASGNKVILLSSTGATAEGVNYQSFNLLVKIDREYNPKTEDQTDSRVQRIGQDKQVTIINLHLNPINTYYGEINVDDHIQSIRDSKIELSKCIDVYNCAFKFRRYYITDTELGITHECGTNFGDDFENLPEGTPDGPNSYGPLFIH